MHDTQKEQYKCLPPCINTVFQIHFLSSFYSKTEQKVCFPYTPISMYAQPPQLSGIHTTVVQICIIGEALLTYHYYPKPQFT